MEKLEYGEAIAVMRQSEQRYSFMMSPAVRAKHTCRQAHAAEQDVIHNGAGLTPEQAAMAYVECLTQYECARAMDPCNSGLVTSLHLSLVCRAL